MKGTIYQRIGDWLDDGASLSEVEARLEHRTEQGGEDERSARWLEDRYDWQRPSGDAADRLADIDRRSFG